MIHSPLCGVGIRKKNHLVFYCASCPWRSDGCHGGINHTVNWWRGAWGGSLLDKKKKKKEIEASSLMHSLILQNKLWLNQTSILSSTKPTRTGITKAHNKFIYKKRNNIYHLWWSFVFLCRFSSLPNYILNSWKLMTASVVPCSCYPRSSSLSPPFLPLPNVLLPSLYQSMHVSLPPFFPSLFSLPASADQGQVHSFFRKSA